jgi:hypothetical protein
VSLARPCPWPAARTRPILAGFKRFPLPSGTHNYAFFATDGTNDWSDPPTPGLYSGLTVSAKGAALRAPEIRAPRPDNAPYAYDPG